MAAQLSANPWKVGSADGIPVVCTTACAKLRHIEYTGYTAGSTGAIVQDNAGNEVAKLIPDTATSTEALRTANVGYVTGVKVTACPSGEVLIYFE